ncbi:MAG: hypothetical protein NPIRA03_38980 [Nitrospirales bacterium]|nr:MAG: hypothetical protein NPIRA03_38980 [Nitrospirales bacterium]
MVEPGKLVRPSTECVRTIQCADLGGTVFAFFSRINRPALNQTEEGSVSGPEPGSSHSQSQTYIHGPQDKH